VYVILSARSIDADRTVEQPETGLGDYSGRQIRYGIREFAMIGISNGMNAYQNGMIIPYVPFPSILPCILIRRL
jgi:transketolase